MEDRLFPIPIIVDGRFDRTTIIAQRPTSMKNSLFSTMVAAGLMLPPSLFGDESPSAVARDSIGRAAQQPDAKNGKRPVDSELPRELPPATTAPMPDQLAQPAKRIPERILLRTPGIPVPPVIPPSWQQKGITPGSRKSGSKHGVLVTRVTSLDIEADVFHWKNFVEPDGLRIRVLPRTADGHAAPVNGMLEVRLIGYALNRRHRRLRRPDFPVLARWNRRVSAEEFDEDGAVYTLPFRLRHPDFDFDVGYEAVVTARLVVPGSGVVNASDGNVWLREQSRIRDWRQQRDGQRYFPSERTRQWRRERSAFASW